MAGCIITKGTTTPACGDRFSSPGVNRDDVYIFTDKTYGKKDYSL